MALPENNGYLLAGKLRAVEPDLKVLFVSGPTGAVISSFHNTHSETDSILYRPYAPRDLLAAVAKLLMNGTDSAAAGA
jgi:hypothetical protein